MIDDVNDNDPVFNTSSYVANVMENSNTSTSVATVYAKDQDQGENGYVTYKITGGNTGGVFQVDNQTGVVSVKGSIDRERISEYSLTIQAEDGGHPSSRKVWFNMHPLRKSLVYQHIISSLLSPSCLSLSFIPLSSYSVFSTS